MLRHAATCCDMLRFCGYFFCFEANRRFVWFMQWCPDALWATEKHPMHTEAYGQLLVPSLLRQNHCHLQTPRIRVVHAVSQKGCLTNAYYTLIFQKKKTTQITIWVNVYAKKNTVNAFDAEVTRDSYTRWTMTFRQCHDITIKTANDC